MKVINRISQISPKEQLRRLQAELYALDTEVKRATYDPSLSLREFAVLNARAARKREQLKAAYHRMMGMGEN